MNISCRREQRHTGPRLGGLLLTVTLCGLAGCGGGGDRADASEAAGTNASALSASQPGELTTYVQSRLRAREPVLRARPDARFGGAPATDFTLQQVIGTTASVQEASAESAERSITTVQETGVDEPDLLQTDGNSLFALDLQSTAAKVKLYRRGGDGSPVQVGNVDVATDGAFSVRSDGMVLSADQRALAVITERWHTEPCAAGGCPPCPAELLCIALVPTTLMRSSVAVQRVDLADVANASPGDRVAIDGRLVDSRRIGDMLYVVTSHVPTLPIDALSVNSSAAAREAAIAATTGAQLLPRVRRNGGAAVPLLADTDCWVQTGNGSLAVQITTITVLDLRSPTLAHTSRCFVGGTEAMYMTPQSLYLATSRWNDTRGGDAVAVYVPDVKTDIHKFTVGGAGAAGIAYRASGEVAGHLGWNEPMKPYRLSEWNGDLRVLSYTQPFGWLSTADLSRVSAPPASPARLTVLRERAGDPVLQAVSTLPNERRPAAIGKPAEQVYAVRFIGNRAYVVTFRVTDPLYVLDLTDPADPQVAGELEVPGFSNQLFALGGGLLLGVGHDAGADGALGGVKLALFDVADAARPSQLDSVVLGGRGSISALDFTPHGISMLASGSAVRVALPMGITESAPGGWTQGLQRFEVDTALRRLRTLPMLGATRTPGWPSIANDRSVHIGGRVYYLDDGGLSGHLW